MGYSENFLPMALAELGHEVHVVSSDLQPDFPNYKEAYEPFLGQQQQPCGVTTINGFSLHRLPHKRTRHGIVISGLGRYLKTLDPDVIQCFGIPQISTYQSAIAAFIYRKHLFLEEHTHLSTIRPPELFIQKVDKWMVRWILGPAVGLVSQHCYAIAPDVAELTLTEFGFPRDKLSIQSLGVDTRMFHPVRSVSDVASRHAMRQALGFGEEDIVCVYSGRFSLDKAPQILADAVHCLHSEDARIKALFIGAGAAADVRAIESRDGCLVRPFMPVVKLADFYRACDVGVWPKQESTSQLDAMACGLPIVVSDRVQTTERIDGNGMSYQEGDAEDLAGKLRLLIDLKTRKKLGAYGAAKVQKNFSWEAIAKERERDYLKVLKAMKS